MEMKDEIIVKREKLCSLLIRLSFISLQTRIYVFSRQRVTEEIELSKASVDLSVEIYRNNLFLENSSQAGGGDGSSGARQ